MRIMLFVDPKKFVEADIRIKEYLASILQSFILIELHIRSSSSSSSSTTEVSSVISNNAQNSQATANNNINNGQKEEKKFAFLIDSFDASIEKTVKKL